MELTEVKNGLFGYKKADVVKYISELNELHNAKICEKDEEYALLKTNTDKEIASLKENINKDREKIKALEDKVLKLTAELNEAILSLNKSQEKYNSLSAETSELRQKSEVIATAIINAEKCAEDLVGKAKSDAGEIIKVAEGKVKLEKDKLDKAKDYIRQVREEIRNTFSDIEATLVVAENDLDTKIKSVEGTEQKQSKFDISRFKRA